MHAAIISQAWEKKGNRGRIAWCFQYPSSELTTNTKNYQAALTDQFGGKDDINGIMKLLK